MTAVEDRLRHIARALDQLGRRYALVGGLAVSVRAEPRFTRDADVAVSVVDDTDAEQLVLQLRQAGYEVLALVEQEATGRLATVRLSESDGSGIVTDLLFASAGIEPEIVARAELLSVVPGLTLPVASVAHLIAMKLLARDDERRPLDAADLLALADIAGPSDWAEAEVAVALIASRGYDRDRDLPAALAELQAGRGA